MVQELREGQGAKAIIKAVYAIELIWLVPRINQGLGLGVGVVVSRRVQLQS